MLCCYDGQKLCDKISSSEHASDSIEDKIKQMCGDAFEWMDCSSIKFQRRGASRALKKSRIWKKNAPEVGDQTRLVRGNAAKRLDQIF